MGSWIFLGWPSEKCYFFPFLDTFLGPPPNNVAIHFSAMANYKGQPFFLAFFISYRQKTKFMSDYFIFDKKKIDHFFCGSGKFYRGTLWRPQQVNFECCGRAVRSIERFMALHVTSLMLSK